MLFVRIAQGIGTGFLCSLVTGLIIGTIGFVEHPLTPWLLLILTYLPAGLIAGRKVKKPYLAAGLAGFILSILNQGFAFLAFGPVIMGDILTMFFSLLLGLAFILLGALIMDKPWNRNFSRTG